jgi:hypothetical protein
MAADIRNYSQGVRLALAALCGGTCYWPGCGEPVIRFVGDEPISNLQIAHITGATLGGPRHVPSMTDEERKAFTNLILLCHPHHTIVDKLRPQDFSISTLQKWKASREAKNQEALSRLREVTPDALQIMLAGALKERDERLDDAIEQFKQVNAEAAQLLQSVLDELQVLRQAGTYGLTEEFIDAANRLHPDILEEFANAAQRLNPEVLEQFVYAIDRLPDR